MVYVNILSSFWGKQRGGEGGSVHEVAPCNMYSTVHIRIKSLSCTFSIYVDSPSQCGLCAYQSLAQFTKLMWFWVCGFLCTYIIRFWEQFLKHFPLGGQSLFPVSGRNSLFSLPHTLQVCGCENKLFLLLMTNTQPRTLLRKYLFFLFLYSCV